MFELWKWQQRKNWVSRRAGNRTAWEQIRGACSLSLPMTWHNLVEMLIYTWTDMMCKQTKNAMYKTLCVSKIIIYTPISIMLKVVREYLKIAQIYLNGKRQELAVRLSLSNKNLDLVWNIFVKNLIIANSVRQCCGPDSILTFGPTLNLATSRARGEQRHIKKFLTHKLEGWVIDERSIIDLFDSTAIDTFHLSFTVL